MVAFTVRVDSTYQALLADQFAVMGRTFLYLPMTMKVLGCDRRNGDILTLSANLSAQALNLGPLGVSAPGALLFFMADQPVDLRTNAASDATFLSAVRQMTLGATLSALFVTTGSAATTILLEVVGGSAAVVQTSLPVP